MNHSNIAQKFGDLHVETPVLRAGLAGITGKKAVPISQYVIQETLSDFILEGANYPVGNLRLMGQITPSANTNVVISFGGQVVAQFSPAYAAPGDTVEFLTDVFWDNDQNIMVGSTQYNQSAGTTGQDWRAVSGITITDPDTLTITSDYGASGYALKASVLILGGGI